MGKFAVVNHVRVNVPLTPEMFKDWIGPDGYSDFQKGEYFCVPYKGGHAVFSLDEGSIIDFACTVWDDGGHVGSRRRRQHA